MFNSTKFKKKISIIGAGNLASHLLPALENGGFAIGEIYSRNIKNAESLSSRLYQGKAQSHLDFSGSNSELFLVAVCDEAIPEIATNIILPSNAIIAHTSGTTSIDTLKKHEHRGVFYPIQTFSKNRKINFEKVPIVIESSDVYTKETLVALADGLKSNYTFLNSEERKTIHLAAVFACNFTNHLLGIAQEILDREDLEFSILAPLIEETIAKAISSGNPYLTQTGPAKRKDDTTMHQHLTMLSETKDLKYLYQIISDRIQEM